MSTFLVVALQNGVAYFAFYASGSVAAKIVKLSLRS